MYISIYQILKQFFYKQIEVGTFVYVNTYRYINMYFLISISIVLNTRIFLQACR